MSYSANSGSFGLTGSDLGASGLSSLSYSPPAAPDGTPAQVPLTELYQGFIVVEYDSTQTLHYQAITSSAPFIGFSFEVLRQTGFRLVPSLTTNIGAETNRLPARATAKCVT